MADKNSFDAFIRNNPLFTTEEVDNQGIGANSYAEESDNEKLKGEGNDKPKRRVLRKAAKNPMVENMVVKTKNRLVGNVDLLNTIGADQIRMETLDINDEELKQQRELANEDRQHKNFTKFVQEPRNNNMQIEKPELNDVMKNLISKMGNHAMNEEDIEIDIVYDEKQITKVSDNTKELKRQLFLDGAFTAQNKKKDIGEKMPLLRSREDLARIYQANIIQKKSLRVVDRSELLDRFKKKTYEDMMVEMEEKKKNKEEVEDNKDSDYKEGDEEEDDFDEEEELLAQDDEAQDEEGLGIDAELNEETNMDEEFGSLIDDSNQDDEHRENDESNLSEENEAESNCQKANIHENELKDKIINEIREIKDQEQVPEEDEVDNRPRKLKTIREKKEEQKIIRQTKRAEREADFEKIKKKLKNNYFEEEAEEGSENEEHDHIAKTINKNDADEDENGLDVSDEELIDRGEVDFNEENELLAHRKLIKDLLEDEKRELQQVMNGNFFKRAEDEYNILVEDEKEKKDKLKRMEEMLKFLENNQNDLLNLDTVGDTPAGDNYGIDLDNENKNINKQYNYEDYKKDMKYLIRKYGHKIKGAQKAFFTPVDNLKMNVQASKQVNKPQFFTNSLLDMKKSKMQNTFQTGFLLQK